MTYDKFNSTGTRLANAIIETLANEGITAKIQKTYRDYGQDWSWDTILVCKNGDRNFVMDSYQLLSPREWEALNNGDFTELNIKEIVATAKRLDK